MTIVTDYYSKTSSITDLTKPLKKMGRESSEVSNQGKHAPKHSQHKKYVSLMLYTGGKITGNLPSDNEFIFPVNPDEFSLARQHRVQVVQTLGDPFIDEFGPGIPTLSMRGTTGWRTRPTIQNIDGHEAYRKLNRDFIQKFFELRLNKQNSNQNPDDIKLIVVNNVDDLVYQIVPMEFRLMRNKSRPLLYQYDLSFKVIQDLGDIDVAQAPIGTNNIQSKSWFDGLKERINPLVDKATAYTSPVSQSIGKFMKESVDVLTKVKSGVGDVANFIGGVSDSIESVLDAATDTDDFINDLFLDGIIELNNLTGVIGEFNCYLRGASKDTIMPDFSGVNGITDCAATHNIPAGEQANSPGNAMEWVDQLNEATRQNGTTPLITTTFEADSLPDIFEEPEAPVVASSSLDSKLETLSNIARDTSTARDLDAVYNAIEETIDSITLDPEKVPEEDTLEGDLVELSRYKKVVAKDGQSLIDIAYQEYGDADRWPDIAAANDIVIENCKSILAPYTTFTLDQTLYAGVDSIEFDYVVPTAYAAAGCTLEMKDKNGRRQSMKVESVVGHQINFFEKFSTTMEGPISVIRYTDLAQFGVSIGKTAMTSDVRAGLRTFWLNDIKDIYPGFVLFISGKNEARNYTVKTVNYLEKYVTVKESSVGFQAGDQVEIFNTETQMEHLAPGTELQIPVMSDDNAGIAQNDNEIYGGDLTLDSKGIFLVKNGDLALSRGLDNLKQAITHRVVSEYESLIIHPNYGCGLLGVIGRKNKPAARTLARAALVEALQREPRIDRISNLQVVTTGDIIQFSVKAESADSNTTTDLNFVIGV